MKIDGGISTDLKAAGADAARLESLGYDGGWTAEIKSDPFLPLLLGAEQSEAIELGTGIAVAFARNPMTLANTAYDLQAHSGGRFILGLGSQIKPHITKRFSMPWSKPAARMREMVQALQAIWGAWNDGTKLDFQGEFYTHTLMTPMFNPGPNPHGNPKIFLAAVGPLMTQVCGEVADGLLAHGFTTAGYMESATLPALRKGLELSGRTRADVEISLPLFLVVGDADQRVERAQPVKQQIAFYGSTPAYRGVLEHHGWDDLHPQLNAMSKRNEWVEMADLITDDVLDAFAIQGQPEDIPGKVAERFGGLIDRVMVYAPYDADPKTWAPLVNQIREI